MYTPRATKKFEKDVALMRKQGKNMKKLISIMKDLAAGKILDAHHKDHKLIGDYVNHRECHIEADWLLIYRIAKEFIWFERTGTHAKLFR
jgi:mRNA interferase YafQ